MNGNKYLSLSGLSIFCSKFKEWIDSKFATEEYVDTEIANLVNSAPETLDTLGELAIALQENQSVTDALDAAITTKANQSDLTTVQNQLNNTETWIFTLSNGSTVTKNVVVK